MNGTTDKDTKNPSEQQTREIFEEQTTPHDPHEYSEGIEQLEKYANANPEQGIEEAEKFANTQQDLRSQEENPQAPAADGSGLFNREEGAAKQGFFGGKGKAKAKLNRPFSRRQLFGFFAGLGVTGLLFGGLFAGSLLSKGNIFSGMLNDFYAKILRESLQRRMRAYMGGWISSDLFEGARTCGTTVNLRCVNRAAPNAPRGLFGDYVQAMRRGRANQALVQQGIAISYDERTRTFKIITRQGNIDVPDSAESIGQFNRQLIRGRHAAYREMNRVITHSFDDRATQRMVSRALRRQFGLQMCFMFCTTRDNLQIRQDDFALRLEGYFNAMAGAVGARIIRPQNAVDRALLKCLTDDCTQASIREELERIDTEESRRLAQDRNQLEQLTQDGAELRRLGRTNGLQQLAMRRVLSLFVGDETAESTARATARSIPIIGWVLLAITVNAMRTKLQGVIFEHWPYNNVAQNMWDNKKKQAYLGAFNFINSGGQENTGANSDTNGNGYDLTALAAYNDRLDGVESASAYPFIFGSLANQNLFTSQQQNATCTEPFSDEQRPPPDGELHCTNDKLGEKPPFVRDADSFFENWPISDPGIIAYISGIPSVIVNELLNHMIDALVWALKQVPGVSAILDFALDQLNKAMQFLLDTAAGEAVAEKMKEAVSVVFQGLLPTCATDQSEVRGSCLGTMAMIGADYGNNVYARGSVTDDGQVAGIGAPPINDEQVNNYVATIEADEAEQQKYASINERFFSVENPKSVFSQLFFSGPTATMNSPEAFMATASNPFSQSLAMISNLMTSQVHAQQYAVVKRGQTVTGVPQFGYDPEGEYITKSPITITQEECDVIIGSEFKKTDAYNNINDRVYEATPQARQCLLDREAIKLGTYLYTGDEL